MGLVIELPIWTSPENNSGCTILTLISLRGGAAGHGSRLRHRCQGTAPRRAAGSEQPTVVVVGWWHRRDRHPTRYRLQTLSRRDVFLRFTAGNGLYRESTWRIRHITIAIGLLSGSGGICPRRRGPLRRDADRVTDGVQIDHPPSVAAHRASTGDRRDRTTPPSFLRDCPHVRRSRGNKLLPPVGNGALFQIHPFVGFSR